MTLQVEEGVKNTPIVWIFGFSGTKEEESVGEKIGKLCERHKCCATYFGRFAASKFSVFVSRRKKTSICTEHDIMSRQTGARHMINVCMCTCTGGIVIEERADHCSVLDQ